MLFLSYNTNYIFKCCITYFNVLYHGERFQIKGTFSKVHRQQKIKPVFPPSIFGKITSYLQRDNLQDPDVLLACSTCYLL